MTRFRRAVRGVCRGSSCGCVAAVAEGLRRGMFEGLLSAAATGGSASLPVNLGARGRLGKAEAGDATLELCLFEDLGSLPSSGVEIGKGGAPGSSVPPSEAVVSGYRESRQPQAASGHLVACLGTGRCAVLASAATA